MDFAGQILPLFLSRPFLRKSVLRVFGILSCLADFTVATYNKSDEQWEGDGRYGYGGLGDRMEFDIGNTLQLVESPDVHDAVENDHGEPDARNNPVRAVPRSDNPHRKPNGEHQRIIEKHDGVDGTEPDKNERSLPIRGQKQKDEHTGAESDNPRIREGIGRLFIAGIAGDAENQNYDPDKHHQEDGYRVEHASAP